MSFRTYSAVLVVGLGLSVAGCAPEAAAENAPAPIAGHADAGFADDAHLMAAVAEAPVVKVFKSPTCGCCSMWVDHMRAAGFEVETTDTDDMISVKVDAGLPLQLQSCHTAFIGDYVFEGHMPAATIAKFLAEAPDAKGLAVPGMPIGSPGMEMGDRKDPYDVLVFDADGNTAVYESH